MAKTIAALQVALDLESAAFVTQTDAAKRKAKELGDTLQATSETVQKSGNAAREAAGGFELATRQKSQMGDVARNAGYQIQDFAVQVGSGTSATQALTQQLPQLLSAFGAVGVVLGTVAAVTIPLLSAGFTALVGNIKSVEDAAKDVTSAAGAFAAANNKAGLSLEEISEKYYASAAPALKALYGQLRAITELRLGEQIKGFAGSLRNEYAGIARLAVPEFLKFFVDSPAEKLAKDFGITERQATQLFDTLRKFERNEATFAQLRDQVLGLNLAQRNATDTGKKFIEQLLATITTVQEARTAKTDSEISVEREAKKTDDAAKRRAESEAERLRRQTQARAEAARRRAESEAERLRRETQARAEAARRYIESLDQQIRKLREGEDAALRFEAAKFGPQASARAEDLIAARRADEARKAAEKEAERAARDAQRESERQQREAERAAREAERERERQNQALLRDTAEAERVLDRSFEALQQQNAKQKQVALKELQDAEEILDRKFEILQRSQQDEARIYQAKAAQETAAAQMFVESIRAQTLALQLGDTFNRRNLAARVSPEASQALEDLLREENIERFKREIESVRTPFEVFEKKVLDVDEALRAGYINTEDYIKLIARYGEQLNQALTKPKDSLSDLMRLLDRTGEKFTETFVQMALTGKATFRDMVNSIAQDLLRLTVRQYITTPLFDFFKAALPTPAGKASGGPVDAGAPYIVGERGPELFVPAFRGTVVANDKLGGSTIVNNYNIQAIDVKSFEDRLLASNKTVFAANMYAQKSLSPQGRA